MGLTYSSIQHGQAIEIGEWPIQENDFNPNEDAIVLNSAMSGAICAIDKRTIISTLCRRNPKQISLLCQTYKSMYTEDLISELRKTFKPNFSTVAQALVTDRWDFYAHQLRAILLDSIVDKCAVIEILCCLSSSELRSVLSSYSRIFKKTLEQDLNGYTSGNFKKLCISLAKNFRDEDPEPSEYLVRFDALMLCDSDPRGWAQSDSFFNGILAGRSFEHLRQVFDEYKKISGKDVEDVIQKMNDKFGLLTEGQQGLVKRAKCETNYLAERLLSGFYKSRKTFGSNERTLMRIIVGRSGLDLGQIQNAFEQICGETLEKWIRDDTIGDFRNALLAIVRTTSLSNNSTVVTI